MTNAWGLWFHSMDTHDNTGNKDGLSDHSALLSPETINGPALMSWLIRSAPVPFKAIYMDTRNILCILFILPGQPLAWFGATIKSKQDKTTSKLSCRRCWVHWTLGSSPPEHSLTNTQQSTLENNVLCPSEAPSAVLCPVLGSPVQER